MVFKEGLAGVNLNKQWYFIDKEGKKRIQINRGKPFDFSDGLALVKYVQVSSSVQVYLYDCKYIDKDGNEIIHGTFQDALSFHEGLAAVKLKDKWGFINKKGDVKIQYRYAEANNFNKGVAKVKLDDSYVFINKDGIEVKNYVEEKQKKYIDEFKSFELDKKFGFKDKNGQITIQCKYKSVGEFSENGFGIIYYQNKWGHWDVYGLIDKKGTEYFEGKYWDNYEETKNKINNTGDLPF